MGSAPLLRGSHPVFSNRKVARFFVATIDLIYCSQYEQCSSACYPPACVVVGLGHPVDQTQQLSGEISCNREEVMHPQIGQQLHSRDVPLSPRQRRSTPGGT